MLIGLLGALGSAGQSADEQVAELIAALDSESFVERELATNELRSRRTISLEDLEAALTVDELTLEQRRRLTMAAQIRFMTEPRAAMGITLGPVTEIGLRIEGTTRGFDAAEKLEPGDVISSIDGVEIRSLTDLQVSIVSNAPGAVVPVEYVREGVRGEVDVQLGSWGDLPRTQGSPQREVLMLSWLHRSRAYRSMTEPAAVPALGAPVSGAPSSLPGGARRGVRRDRPVAGGEAREAAPQAVGIDVGRKLSSRLDERATDFAGLVASTLRDLEERAEQKRDRIARLERDASRAKERGDLEALDEYQERRDRLYRELGILLDQIDRYQSVQATDRP